MVRIKKNANRPVTSVFVFLLEPFFKTKKKNSSPALRPLPGTPPKETAYRALKEQSGTGRTESRPRFRGSGVGFSWVLKVFSCFLKVFLKVFWRFWRFLKVFFGKFSGFLGVF